MSEQSRSGTGRGGSGRFLVAAIALSGIALLIWGKLRLVTGIPRTAYAVPREKAAEDPALKERAGADPETEADGAAGR